MEDVFVGGWQAAQAVEFVRALRGHLLEMTSRLAWLEGQHVAGRAAKNDRERAMRVEAATLRGDINEAQFLIERLQHCYLTHTYNKTHRRRS